MFGLFLFDAEERLRAFGEEEGGTQGIVNVNVE